MTAILLVEDDVFLREGLTELLTREGYRVESACCGKEANAQVRANPFDLAVVDIGLPDADGIALLKAWRAQMIAFPVLFLTACDEEIQIVRALDAGGDDYVVKPFRMLELLSRIRALLRREGRTETYCEGELAIDWRRMTAKRDGEDVFLTQTEWKLLAALLRNRGRVVTREALLQSIWDEAGQFIDDNTLSVHMSRLREKIGAQRVRTMRGVGYQWRDGR